MDGDDRSRRTGTARPPPGRDVRRGVRRRARRDYGRHVQPDWEGDAGRWRVSRQWSLVVRQRLPARPLVPRPQRRRRRTDAAAADDGAAGGGRRHRRHLVNDGYVRYREPRLHRRPTSSSPTTARSRSSSHHELDFTALRIPELTCRRWRSAPSPSASLPVRSPNSSISPAARCRCSPTRRWRPTRCSVTNSATPTPRCGRRGPCCTATPLTPWRWPSMATHSTTWRGRGSAARRPGWPRPRPTVVDVAYRAGGGSALYTSSPLQRRLRDIHTLTQHFGVKLDTFTLAGAVLAGQDVDTTFL